MQIFELVGKLTLEGQDKIKQELSGLEGALEKHKTKLRAVGAAFTAAGAAGLVMINTSKKLNAELGMVGITLGVSTKEMRDLALATTDVTFSLDSVIQTFDLLTRAGMRNTEEMKATAKAFDMLADATRSSAEEVASSLVPAFKVFGIELAKAGDEVDKLTWLTKNTTISLGDFASVMDYVAMYGANLNVTIEDMVGIMAALEAKGMSGASATRLFRTAVSQAKDGAVTLTEALQLTTEEVDKYKAELSGATGITQRYADMANTQFTIMDKIKQKWSELTLKLSGFLEPLEPILAAMTALGPVMIFLSTQIGRSTVLWLKKTIAIIASKVALIAHTVASRAAAIAMWLLNAAMSANPFVLVAIAISAVIGALLIFRNRVDSATNEAEKHFGELADKAKASFLSITMSGKEMTDSLRQDIVNAIDPMFDEIIAKLESRKGDFIKAFVGMYSDAKTMSQEEMAATINRITGLFDEELAVVKEGKERINEIYSIAAEEHREVTDAENTEVLNIWRDMYSKGIAIASEGSKKYEDIWAELASAGETINSEMYRKILGLGVDAAKQGIEDKNTQFEELKKLALENVGILTGYTQAMADEDIANAERARDETINAYKDETIGLVTELDKRISAWDKFWMQVGEKIQYLLFSTPSPSAEARAVSEIKIPTLPSLQYGGIVPGALGQPVPIIAHGGEPFGGVGGAGMTVHRETNIHIHGDFMGDELSFRQFARKLQEVLREEERRTAFSGVNTGYFFGGSHI